MKHTTGCHTGDALRFVAISETFCMKAVAVLSVLLFLPVRLWAQRVDCRFVTPQIVCIQWSANGKLKENDTGICIYQLQQVKVKESVEGRSRVFSSSALAVAIELIPQKFPIP